MSKRIKHLKEAAANLGKCLGRLHHLEYGQIMNKYYSLILNTMKTIISIQTNFHYLHKWNLGPEWSICPGAFRAISFGILGLEPLAIRLASKLLGTIHLCQIYLCLKSFLNNTISWHFFIKFGSVTQANRIKHQTNPSQLRSIFDDRIGNLAVANTRYSHFLPNRMICRGKAMRCYWNDCLACNAHESQHQQRHGLNWIVNKNSLIYTIKKNTFRLRQILLKMGCTLMRMWLVYRLCVPFSRSDHEFGDIFQINHTVCCGYYNRWMNQRAAAFV